MLLLFLTSARTEVAIVAVLFAGAEYNRKNLPVYLFPVNGLFIRYGSDN